MKVLQSVSLAAIATFALGVQGAVATPIVWAPILINLPQPFVIDAFLPKKITVVANYGGVDEPELVGIAVQGSEIVASFYATENDTSFPFRVSIKEFDLPELPPGTYKLKVVNTMLPGTSTSRTLTVAGTPALLAVVPMMATNEVSTGFPAAHYLRTKHYLALGEAEQDICWV